MTGTYRLLLLVTLIVLALTCYLAGSQTGAVTFLWQVDCLKQPFGLACLKNLKIEALVNINLNSYRLSEVAC
jgi:hypothetical protein